MSIEVEVGTINVDKQILFVLLQENRLVDIYHGNYQRTVLNKDDMNQLISALQVIRDRMTDHSSDVSNMVNTKGE